MRQRGFAVALLSMVIGSAGLVHGQGSVPKSTPPISVPDISKLSIGKMLEQLQTTKVADAGEPPAPIQVVAAFLQLRPDQLDQFGQLLQARQVAVVPLLAEIQQRVKQLEGLLNSGGSPPEIGVLVIQIHMLQQRVAQVQQDFLSGFVSLLDPDQRQRLQTVGIAAQLQPVLPAFQQLYLF